MMETITIRVDVLEGVTRWAEMFLLFSVGFICGLFGGVYMMATSGGEQ